jgi:TatD DNase family protein
MLFDSHAHLDDKRFDPDRDEIIGNLQKSGVGGMLNAASSLDSIGRSIELAEKYDFIVASAGVHPSDTRELNEENFNKIEKALAHPKVKAVGEIGLDYHYPDTNKPVQQKWFKRQMALAADADLPVIIHDREAHGDCLNMVRQFSVRGVFHSYSGSIEMAAILMEMGYYISFTGVITFHNARGILDVVRWAPIDRVLIETDCPYLTPEPYRGKRNQSAYVRYVAEKIAELKKMPFRQVAEITSQNARELFRIG